MFEERDENDIIRGRSAVVQGSEASAKVQAGVKLAADVVGSTLGPKGKCVVVTTSAVEPVVTKDGVTVSKNLNPKDPVVRVGVRLVRAAAEKTNDAAGDGTTTASVLAGSMVATAAKYVAGGLDAVELKKGLEDATDRIVEELKRSSTKIDDEDSLAHVATISANGDSVVGCLVAEAVHRTGVDGVVSVENSRTSETTLEIVDGLRFERGYLSPYFVTHQDKMRAEYEECAVLVTDRKLSSLKELVPLLEDCNRNQKPLLIIAEEVDGDALQGLVLNRANGSLRVVAVKLPGVGSQKEAIVKDLISLVGGVHPTTFSETKLESCKCSTLGVAKTVRVDGKSTTIVAKPDAAARVTERVESVRKQLEDVALSDQDIEFLKLRIAKLSNGAAIVRVGGSTELELVEKKYRVEDALHATKAALEEGILPGGGTALHNVRKILQGSEDVSSILKKGDDYSRGWCIALEACHAPLLTIAKNAGTSGKVILATLETLKEDGFGWNAATDEYVDMVKFGVIDPAKVTTRAFTHAASVAGVFLTLDAVIYEEE